MEGVNQRRKHIFCKYANVACGPSGLGWQSWLLPAGGEGPAGPARPSGPVRVAGPKVKKKDF
jgi:hypothetical protein